MSGLDLMASKGEKNLLLSMFRDSDDSDTISQYSDTEEVIDDISLVSASISCGSEVTMHFSLDATIVITLRQDQIKGIAHHLWPAATFMCNYFESNWSSIMSKNQSFNIIELGAGIGLCGIFLARLLGAKVNRVILTDLNEAMENLNHNLALNDASHNLEAMVLSWGNTEDLKTVSDRLNNGDPLPLLVIAADCVYWESLFEPFLQTLLRLTELPQCQEIIISHVRRWKRDGKFFQMCSKRGLIVEVIHELVDQEVNEHTGVPSRRITRIYRIKRPEAMNIRECIKS